MEKGELPGLSERLVWHDATHLQVGDTRFFLTIDQNAAGAAESTAEQFVLMKLDVLVNSTLEHLPDSIENMVELGIYKGGSIAMNEELYSPQKFVGIEGSAKRVQALDNFIQQRGATDRIKLYYGTDQGDRTTVESIALENFGGERCLDLVIDDCSHLYEPTKTSLNVFLPLLRYGGIYLIEDWGWAHWFDEANQYENTFAQEETPLAKLILEAVMLSATSPHIIADVFIDQSRAFIRRGGSKIVGDCDISAAYATSLWSMEFSRAQNGSSIRKRFWHRKSGDR